MDNRRDEIKALAGLKPQSPNDQEPFDIAWPQFIIERIISSFDSNKQWWNLQCDCTLRNETQDQQLYLVWDSESEVTKDGAMLETTMAAEDGDSDSASSGRKRKRKDEKKRKSPSPSSSGSRERFCLI